MRHVTRLSHGDCELRQGTAFNELLNSFERITAHCTGAITAVIKMEENDPDMHIHSSILDEEQGYADQRESACTGEDTQTDS